MSHLRSITLLCSIYLFSFLLLLTNCTKDPDPGKEPSNYESVTIGNQEWMVHNLNVVTYRNGDPIPMIKDSTNWVNATGGAYCNYNNDTSLVKTYGRIYNWYAINDNRKLAPEGWHVATAAEWKALVTHLGGVDVAGGKLKVAGFEYWASPNQDATNSSGYSALPGGFRSSDDGTFNGMGRYGAWWLANAVSDDYASSAALTDITGKAYSNENLKNFGAYIRCVKD